MHHKKYLAAAIVIWAINFSGTASASMNTNDCIFTLDEVVVKGLRYRYNVSKYGDKAENIPFSYTAVSYTHLLRKDMAAGKPHRLVVDIPIPGAKKTYFKGTLKKPAVTRCV